MTYNAILYRVKLRNGQRHVVATNPSDALDVLSQEEREQFTVLEQIDVVTLHESLTSEPECQHEAWEVTGTARQCADCRAYLPVERSRS